MGLPQLQKTWHFAPNVLITEATDTQMRAELMFQVVRRMDGSIVVIRDHSTILSNGVV